MPISKGQLFTEQNVYVDYPYESVMFRWDFHTKRIYRRFYGENESAEPIPHDNHLYNEALLYGEEISQHVYESGKAGEI